MRKGTFTVSIPEDINGPAREVFFFAGVYANDPVCRAGVTGLAYESGTSAAVGLGMRETMRSSISVRRRQAFTGSSGG